MLCRAGRRGTGGRRVALTTPLRRDAPHRTLEQLLCPCSERKRPVCSAPRLQGGRRGAARAAPSAWGLAPRACGPARSPGRSPGTTPPADSSDTGSGTALGGPGSPWALAAPGAPGDSRPSIPRHGGRTSHDCPLEKLREPVTCAGEGSPGLGGELSPCGDGASFWGGDKYRKQPHDAGDTIRAARLGT